KVEDLYLAVSRNLHVCGLEVSVNDSLLVRGFQSFCNLPRDAEGFVHWDRSTFNSLRQRLAIYKFHDQKRPSTRLFDSMDHCDVGMIQRCQHAGLTLESRHTVHILRERLMKELDRDTAAQF